MAAGTSCPKLTVVNLNYTAVTPISLVPLLTGCLELTVLKLAGIQNWVSFHNFPRPYRISRCLQTDAKFANVIAGVGEDLILPNVRSIKLRQTSLSDASVSFFLARCPNLQRLDLSFTLIQHVPPLLSGTQTLPLQKLSLTSTAVNTADLISIVQLLPQLRTLSLGAMGVNRGSQASISNSSAMTMNDDTLLGLTHVLQTFVHLEDISLVGNIKLGSSSKIDSALGSFICLVGKKCKVIQEATYCIHGLTDLLLEAKSGRDFASSFFRSWWTDIFRGW
jgi:Leucine-rich repeat (LRR) protein